MKKVQSAGHTIFSLLFAMFLAIYSAANFWQAHTSLTQAIKGSQAADPAAVVAAIDSVVTAEILGHDPIVEAYGALQRVINKHEIESFRFVQDKAGYLHSGNFWVGFEEDSQEIAMRMRRLQDALEQKGTRFGFVLMPIKSPQEGTEYLGLPYNDFSRQTQDVLRWLRYYGVPCLNMQEVLDSTGLSYEETYFRTDYYWSPRAAFYGFCGLTEWMNSQWNAGLDVGGHFRDIENYKSLVFPNYMLGYLGRRAGSLYSGGLEDFEVLLPKEEGSFSRLHGELGGTPEQSMGGFTPTLLDLDPNDDIYSSRAARMYLDEMEDYDCIENLDNPGNPRVLLLRDASASALAAFFAQTCGQLDLLDVQACKSGEIEDFLAENKYDYVLVALYPGNLSFDSFPYYESEETP